MGRFMNKRIVIDKPGSADQLHLIEELTPTPKAGEVRIRVLACGVAFGDVLLRQGGTPGATYPITPGYDLVGEIDAVGHGMTHFKVGDRVAGLPQSGAYTTYICLPESEIVPVPTHLNPVEVVSVLLNYTTAFRLLTKAATLKAGDSVLVHGAAGGVGTAVLQLGRVLGLTVYGTVSMVKLDLVRQEGGIPIDYKQTDFVQEIKRLTHTGVDAVLDPIGGPHLSRSYEALNDRGTLVLFGVSSSLEGGGNPMSKTIQTLLRWLWLKLRLNHRRVVTSFLTPKDKGADLNRDVTAMIDLLAQDQIKPIIAGTFPLSEAANAQVMLEQEKPAGKLVLLP